LRTGTKVLERPGEFEQVWPQFLEQLPQTPQGRRDRLLTGGIPKEAAQRTAQLTKAPPLSGERGDNPFHTANGAEHDTARWQWWAISWENIEIAFANKSIRP